MCFQWVARKIDRDGRKITGFGDTPRFCGEVVDSMGWSTRYSLVNPRCFCGDLVESKGWTSDFGEFLWESPGLEANLGGKKRLEVQPLFVCSYFQDSNFGGN